jgi:hypothetical protein
MKKFLVFIIILLSISSLTANEKDKIARLHFDGGGDWYNDRDIVPNIARFLNSNIHTNFSEEQAIVKPSDKKIFDYPFVFMTGHGNIDFSDSDIKNLREYLKRGGFLYADDDYGMDKAFRREIKKLFPQKRLVELPVTHELFHCFYHFNNGIPKIHKHNGKRPQAFAIFDDNGRMIVLYTYETNITDGWSDMHNDPFKIRSKALKFGANIFYYVMTH